MSDFNRLWHTDIYPLCAATSTETLLMDDFTRAAVNRAHSALGLIRGDDNRDCLARDFVRTIIARAINHTKLDSREPIVVARARWGSATADVVQRSVSAAIVGSETAEAAAFFDLVAGASLLGQMPIRRWPFNTRTLASSGVVGGEVFEGAATPIRVPSLSPFVLRPRKFQGATLLTREALTAGGDAFEAGLQNDLLRAVAGAVDSALVTDIVAAEDSDGFSGDRRFAVFLLNPEDAADHADQKLNVLGGEFRGYPCFTSTAVPLGDAVLVDASRVAADWRDGEIDFAVHASLQADDAPTQDSTSPASTGSTTMISLWQTNTLAIRATLQAGWHIADGAVEVVSLGS